MLLRNFRNIGEKLYAIRKKYGLTQLEVASSADLSSKTYAELERGKLNIRLDTLLSLCDALHITPNEILTSDCDLVSSREADILARLQACNPKDKETALRLLEVFLQSVSQE